MNDHSPGSGRSDGPIGLDSPLARKLHRMAALSDDDRQRLAVALSRARLVEAHADILAEGDDPRAVNVVLDGWACRYRQLADGRRQIVTLLLPGDVCDPQVFRKRHVHHALCALTPITLAQIPGGAFQELTARSATLEAAFLHERLTTTAIQHEWTVSLGRRSAIERTAHLLCELHARLEAVGLADAVSCPMPLTQIDLADALGQTPVHINRVLRDLRSQALLILRHRRLTLVDGARLRALALFDPAYLFDDDITGSAQET
ncbi:Crp/Fnr family transcriptional regulator [Methylobacterium sp. NEAU 140]|uniref:Crp/Fnr family transcriptional regulator n=1 Tax=Methylobacterium sp. NEAU 140 TaxID=3064945 RepID=UPI002734116A|nr:Crp/Fnr family transcriptional regulator [Methylobacterium sp. NEAU 140]MDP4026857.1 Crp/Fnr family transcriptional regulator [Methylobacterium sp. NEAU 140]MDP4026965.1 Crp/Fnr family transcriptional regulator [Methylobacterium sp. NEAU 140]MDP4027290.1 Crp/Fnr family transcriptional regulator [Methylobacterium sp. NEAU 140]MDP4027303.1 Crp/Fnr family transcriptional regulator [Methylobacterium sp. NEAU 140]